MKQITDFDAAIFDMDGLLFDTESLAIWGWMEAAKRTGYEISHELALRSVGLDRVQTVALFREVLGPAVPLENIRELRLRLTQERVEAEGVTMKPGAAELLGALAGAGVPCAVATSTARSRALDLLSRGGIIDRFAVIVGGDEISRGKPAPDIYLAAAAHLDVAPSRCVVFEDSGPGITAASRAGMIPVLVPDLGIVPPDARALAAVELRSLEEAVGWPAGRGGRSGSGSRSGPAVH